MSRPRLGHIPFLNSYPLYAGLLQTGAINEIELSEGTPVTLANRMRAGELDVAPLSLIEYLRDAERYLLLPGLAIGSRGAVRSVQLVGRVAPERLTGPVAMTDASATSHVLLALLLKELWSVSVECASCAVDFPDVLNRAEAALLIGDDALRVAAARPDGLHMDDLGKAWYDLTDLPMVFAVWAARREFAREQPAALARVASGLSASLAWSMSHLTDVIAAAPAAGMPTTPNYLRDYFDGLDYGFGDQARAGLMAFAQRAKAHGHLSQVPDLEFAEV